VLATLARLVLEHAVGYRHRYAAFYVAVLCSASFGGLGPALLTAVLGAIAIIGLAFPGPLAGPYGPEALQGFEFYWIVTLSAAFLFEAQRRMQRESLRNAEIASMRLAELERETSQRRIAEETAHQFQEQLRMMFEHVPAGICQFSLDGLLIEVNPQFCEITGNPRKEVLKANFYELLDPEGRAREKYEALRKGRIDVLEQETRLTRRVGVFTWVDVAASLVRGTSGEPRYGVAVVQDATNRKRSEQALLEAQKLESIGMLAGGIAHDFNNLLTAVMGNASLAMDTMPADSGVQRMLSDVVFSAGRAAELTAQLLAYAGKGAFIVDDLDLSAVVRNTCRLVAPSLPSTVQIRLKLDDNLPSLRADPGQIQRILTNLIFNAGEAIAPGNGNVAVSTALVHFESSLPLAAVGEIRRGTYLALRVEDNGRGMEESLVQRIFDPFFTTKFMGRGLGLAAVSGIIRVLHGAILVTSRPGHGSCFSVLFPASTQETSGERRNGMRASEPRGSTLSLT
jgi:PAS domain S-box-containing protein